MQGWIRSKAAARGARLADIPDEEILAMLPDADKAFEAFRAERRF